MFSMNFVIFNHSKKILLKEMFERELVGIFRVFGNTNLSMRNFIYIFYKPAFTVKLKVNVYLKIIQFLH